MRHLIHLLVAGLLLLGGHAVAQPLKIGFVNGVRIEHESALALQALEQVKKEFAPREQQLQEMQKQGAQLQAEIDKEGPTLSSADKQEKEKRLTAMAQQFQQAQRSFAEDSELRMREARAGFLGDVNEIIRSIAVAGKFDLIVQQAVYNSGQIDITDQVMKEIAKRVGAGPAPGK